MSIQGIRKEMSELRKTIIPDEPREKIIMPPEVLRCSKELETAHAQARQRLIDNGTSDRELRELQRMGFVCDPGVIQANHNLLRASWNAENPDKPQIKINYLFDCPVEVENYKRALDKMNSLLNKDRTSEVIEAEYELLRAMTKAGV
jgi:hypothetical protein